MDLSSKTILIIGGAVGIGRASAELCKARGATVIIADYTDPEGWTGESVRVDVTVEDSVKALFAEVSQRFDRLDALVQTAGILKGQFVPLDEFDVATFRQVLDVNVTGSFLCTKHAAPLLRKSAKPVVVLFSSGAATGGSSSLAYGASKAGVNGYFVTLANRMASENIRVNVISPGNIDTPMKRSVIAVDAEKRGLDMQTAVDSSNLGSPEGVARVVAWLVSDEADYVRGIITTR
jgi:3-oxoacyl-[acyl-carrier protein] reductase/2-hydroxycyclohexanecarboxyl-CoA dehydrogenase